MLIQAKALRGYIVILDIDGTLVPSGEGAHALTQLTREWVYQLKLRNRVYLCSNKKVHTRNEAVAEALGVGYLKSSHRKPNARALAGLQVDAPLMVVGDKFLTDELFARNIGARFFKVPRIVSGNESLYDRFHHALDDVAHYVYKKFAT